MTWLALFVLGLLALKLWARASGEKQPRVELTDIQRVVESLLWVIDWALVLALALGTLLAERGP